MCTRREYFNKPVTAPKMWEGFLSLTLMEIIRKRTSQTILES